MARKKKPMSTSAPEAPDRSKPKSPPPGRSGSPHSFNLPPPLNEALQSYIASQRWKPSKTEVFITALEQFLRNEGFLPADPADQLRS
jgi:hypothetical protein